MFQDKHVPGIVNDILKLDSLYNFADEYRFLIQNSQKLLADAKTQAWYLDYYKIIQTFKENICDLIPVIYENREYELVLHVQNTNTLNFYSWKNSNPREPDYFVLTAINEVFPPDDFELISVKFLEFVKKPFLFLESINKEDQSIIGSLYQIEARDKLTPLHVVSDEKAESITSFVLPNEDSCLALVFEKRVDILCEKKENKEMYEFQVLEVPNGKQVICTCILSFFLLSI